MTTKRPDSAPAAPIGNLVSYSDALRLEALAGPHPAEEFGSSPSAAPEKLPEPITASSIDGRVSRKLNPCIYPSAHALHFPQGLVAVSPNAPPVRAELRQGAEEIFARAEYARDQGDLENAARLFGRAAGTWRTTGDVLKAADAYIELGAVLLRQGRGKILSELATRLLGLLEIKPLPEGANLNLRIYAALTAKGNEDREAFLGLVQERRLFRHRFIRTS